jgi:hypothetical protein
VSFTLAAPDPRATIRYSTVPGLERAWWPTYDGVVRLPPFVMSGSWPATVWAIAVVDGKESEVAEATYRVGYTEDPSPVLAPVGGEYAGPVEVTISSRVPSVSIVVTTDGSSLRDWPDSARNYTGPIRVDAPMVIEAMACNERACTQPVRQVYSIR